MNSFSQRDDSFPTPPLDYSPDDNAGRTVRIYRVHSPFRQPPSCSFDLAPVQVHPIQPPPQACASPVTTTPVPKFVSHESNLCRSPALASCPACRAQVTTRVRYRAGTYAWTMCVLFVLLGLLFGCCLLPFLVNHFKDAYHCCPRCHRLLHVHRRRCFP